MTAKSSQFQVRESAASSSTDTEVTCLYGATRASPPVQVEKLKNVTDRINKSDQNYVQLTEQADPLLDASDYRSNHSTGTLGGNDASWSSFADVSVKSASVGFFSHPNIRENWKIVIGSLALTVFGFVMFLAGIGILATTGGLHSIVFFVIGFLCFIPGCYHLVYMYCAFIGRPGYNFQNLPVLK